MYLSYFGLNQAPFSIAPDPRHLYLSDRHREALAHLVYGLRGGGGFVLLTGEIGAGKTTLSRSFLAQVPPNTQVAYIFNPALTVLELLRSICDEFGVVVHASDGTATVKDHLDPLNRFLLQAYAEGRQAVLLIDEAQSLAPGVLEQLRLLTNLETDERKLLQIILIGQPELRELVARPELEQLAQRIIARYHLGALDADETAHYVAHRLAVAGRQGPSPFDDAALRRLHRLSGGIPRRINLIADRALLGAYAAGRDRIDARLVAQAATEVLDRRSRPAPALWSALGWASLGAAGVLGVGAAVTMTARDDPSTPVRPAAVVAPASTPASPPASVAASGQAVSAAAAVASAPAAAASSPTEIALSDDISTWPTASSGVVWRELAAAWGLSLPLGADPCGLRALGHDLACFRGEAHWPVVQRLDRPGLLVLRVPGATGTPVLRYTRLLAADAQTALIGVGKQQRRVRLATLQRVWQGGFQTLWRAPSGYRRPLGEGDAGAPVTRLRALLPSEAGAAPVARASAPAATDRFDAALRQQVSAFQQAQGLPVTGVAGAITFMQLNRMRHVDEPHLAPMPTEGR